MIYTVSASDLLILEDAVLSNIKAETIEDTLNFVEGVFSNFQYASATDTLAFDSYAIAGGVFTLSIADTLDLTDSTQPRVLVATATDFLFMWDTVEQPLAGVISDSFGLTDLLVFTNSKLLNPDTLTFTDSLVIQFIAAKTLSESLALSDALSIVRLPAPIAGYSTAPIDLPVGYVPATVELNVSFSDGTETFQVHCPDFNDSESITYKRINKVSRGYTPIIAGIATWQPKRARKMTFTYLMETEVERIRRFWRRNAGLPVTLTDIYGDVRTVILQNPEFETAQVGRENRSLTLDLYIL